MSDFKGPKTFDEWVEVYERRAGDDVRFQLSPGEEIFYNPEEGFFTYLPDYEQKWLEIPKMVGNGKFLRKVIFEIVKELEPLGIREVYCCSRRRPDVYLRVLGGRLHHYNHTFNINTGKLEPMYYYVVSLDNSKEAVKK